MVFFVNCGKQILKLELLANTLAKRQNLNRFQSTNSSRTASLHTVGLMSLTQFCQALRLYKYVRILLGFRIQFLHSFFCISSGFARCF